MSTVVDARGLSCPEPVLLTQAALSKGSGALTVLVDSPTPRENVSRLLGSRGRTFQVTEENGGWRIEVAGA